MLFLLPFLFAVFAFALKQKEHLFPFQLCPNNVNSTYYIVSLPDPPKSQEQLPSFGMPFTLAEIACESFGLRLANLTQPQLADIYSLGLSCGGDGFWFGVYESLAPPFGCFSLLNSNIVSSNTTVCATDILRAICELPDDIVEPFPTITFTTQQTTSTSTSFIVSVETDTTSVTHYEFMHTTSTVTQGTYTVTCTTSTTTVVHTTHRHHHHPCSSSSSSSGCWNKKNIKSAKKADVFVQCNTSLNNFFLVQNQSLGNNATIEDACNSIGYPVANVTSPILSNIASMFTGCNAPVAGADSWYGYTPLGCLLVGNTGVTFIEDLSGPTYQLYCLNQRWALCRAGPAVITTSTIQTDGFTTLSPFYTLTVTSTSVETDSTSVSTTVTTTSPTTVTTVFFTNAALTTLTTTNSTSVITHIKTRCSTTTVCGNQN